ncbi:MAG: hypothetical protein RR533_02580 [Carnobacterium sp.]
MTENNNEFIEIYEDEIKRLVKKNEDLRVLVEEKENNLHALQHEKVLMQRDLEKVTNLAASMKQLTKQNVLYKEKLESLTNEKVNLTCIVDSLRKNALKYEESNELSSKLEIEKQKVASLQEKLKLKDGQLNGLVKEKEANSGLVENNTEFLELKASNELIKQQLIEEKTELAEILLEARMQSKSLVEVATKEADKIKMVANKELEKSREEARVINNRLKKIKDESSIFVSTLIEEVDSILN